MSDWPQFLPHQALTANHHSQAQNSFEHDALNNHTYLATLKHQGLLAVEGPDAAKFLQGQVTCDVQELNKGVTRLGAQCTIKGRMLISFRAVQLDNERFFLRMCQALVEKALASFGKYIVFSKAKLQDRSENYRRIGLAGIQAEKLMTEVFGLVPVNKDEWQEASGNILIKLDQQRYECWLLPETAERIWDQLANHCLLADENWWVLQDIRAGIGEVRLETQDIFTPQSLNYQLINAISFRKGCYTGQEIIARLHYRGTLKRHMYRFALAQDYAEQLPIPGSLVINQAHKTIGEVIMAARSGKDTVELLAVIADDALTQAYLDPTQPKKLKQLPLPYAIPTEVKAD